jgi:putative Holliday junction resolvase
MPESGPPAAAAAPAEVPVTDNVMDGQMTPPGAAGNPPSPQLVLAFDLGRRRIGVACGDTRTRTASPLTGIANGGAGPRWDMVDTLMRDWQPALLVVGLPYNVDGSESRMSQAARSFADDIAARYAKPVRLIDERYSSIEAETRLRSQRQSGLRRGRAAKADVDAAAACVILERWFGGST